MAETVAVGEGYHLLLFTVGPELLVVARQFDSLAVVHLDPRQRHELVELGCIDIDVGDRVFQFPLTQLEVIDVLGVHGHVRDEGVRVAVVDVLVADFVDLLHQVAAPVGRGDGGPPHHGADPVERLRGLEFEPQERVIEALDVGVLAHVLRHAVFGREHLPHVFDVLAQQVLPTLCGPAPRHFGELALAKLTIQRVHDELAAAFHGHVAGRLELLALGVQRLDESREGLPRPIPHDFRDDQRLQHLLLHAQDQFTAPPPLPFKF